MEITYIILLIKIKVVMVYHAIFDSSYPEMDELLDIHDNGRLVDDCAHVNNYERNHLEVRYNVEQDRVLIDTWCRNEYGSNWSNNDQVEVVDVNDRERVYELVNPYLRPLD